MRGSYETNCGELREQQGSLSGNRSHLALRKHAMMQTYKEDTRNYPPQHVAFIMDGNGRWAQRRGWPRTRGHQAAPRNLLTLVQSCIEIGIPYLTLFTFSTENWRRPRAEVHGMFRVMADFLEQETVSLHRMGIRLQHIGRLDGIDDRLKACAQAAIDLTARNQRLTLTVAFNYGGRADILDAVRKIISQGVDSSSIDEQLFTRYLLTADLPDPDLIIRTSGERRLSNFMLWESAHSYYWTTPVLWPDFCAQHFYQALDAYMATRKSSVLLEGEHHRCV